MDLCLRSKMRCCDASSQASHPQQHDRRDQDDQRRRMGPGETGNGQRRCTTGRMAENKVSGYSNDH